MHVILMQQPAFPTGISAHNRAVYKRSGIVKESHMSSNTTQIMIIAFGMLFVVLNSLGLGLRIQVGHMLAHFFQNWKFAAWVLLINFVILPALIIGFAAVVPIPRDIKIGYCIVALAAGAPFAPLLTRLAKGNVEMSTTLMVILIVVTIIVLPIALSPTVTALAPDVQRIPIWDVAWPLLLFMALPLVVGCLVRLRYPDPALQATRLLQIISIASLLMYVNLFIVADWNLFVSAWGSGSYLASFGVPILGIVFGSLISLKNVGNRHASVITTAQRSISGAIVVTIFNYTQPLANVSVTIINSIGILILLVISLEWGRAQAHKSSVAETAVAAEQVS
jgi:BASS family bile acid:Na+ symporter